MQRLLTLAVLAFGMMFPACAQQNADAQAPALFFEAENFTTQTDGWKSEEGHTARAASRATVLSGSSGKADGVATQEVTIPHAGSWRIWVRFLEGGRFRGPFVVDLLSGDKTVATHDFGIIEQKAAKGAYIWDSFDVTLQPGKYVLRLRKYQNKNSSGYARKVDAFLLTTDLNLKPDITPYGPQTWMKVTLGDGYEKPLHIHIFADHYRRPWYAHYALTKGNFYSGVNPPREQAKDKLTNGESTGWLNISETIYDDSGARLEIYPAYTYSDVAKTFKGTIQFATKPDDAAVVKTFTVDYTPSTISIVVPPNLDTKENIAKLRSDLNFANEYGAIADNYDWPKIGKKPVKFPFFVSAKINPDTMSSEVVARELKTLSYFDFNGLGSNSYFEKFGYNHKSIGGVGWYTKGSYSAPDLEKISARADANYQAQIAAGIKPHEIAVAMVMDEPTGEPLEKIVKDKASTDGFRAWLKSLKLSPQELLVSSWDDVKLVTAQEKEDTPALYYFSEKYRTIALGNFLAIQKKELQSHWKSTFPVVANFSDGAVYHANFYSQGVDYFTLLHETDQNAIWSEDWSNGSSTYQAATYNVELMRAAARKNGQSLGQHLIAYAGRKGFDIRLKTVSEAARGVKVFKSYAYGPTWAGHDPSAWIKNPELWGDQASVVREIGAVEENLLPAMPQKAKVAILYSSASDIWNQPNLVYGFERMNTWLALSHAQIPVDVVGESDVADGYLDGYEVCYLSDPNLTRAAAAKLAAWVQAGGTLVMTAGAGEKDEYNRPLDTLNKLLPYQRNAVETLQGFRASGRSLTILDPKDTAKTGATNIDVLSVKQTFANIKDGDIKSTFGDGTPASIRSSAGKGTIVSNGYLPAIDYVRKALVAKGDVTKKAEEIEENDGIPGPDDVEPFQLNTKSYNPWQYPADVRNAIIAPVQAANVKVPIKCDVPLVDAVYMVGGKDLLIPLANYTLQPIKEMKLEIAVTKPVREVTSVHQGILKFEKLGANKIQISLPLECTDFVTIKY